MNQIKSNSIKFLTITLLLFSFYGNSQKVVNSLQELLPFLKKSNVNVKLAPGIYSITAGDIYKGLYGTETDVAGRLAKSLFLFEGNNSTYDFTGVTLNVDTAVMAAFGGKYRVYQVHTLGNNNVLKNLTLIDVGSVNDAPARTAENIVMDGENNKIEGFHVTAKGSFPYGYGDIFGKGGRSVISHRKHSACLIRGNSNHVKGCTFIHRTYGHCVFFQAANNPLVEDCYIEGELRTTDDVLKEVNTGSPADKVNFKTVWGYRLNPGWTFSLHEAGIRAYNGGETKINGKDYERTTTNPTVKNCTIVNMRVGVNVGSASGYKLIEGCKALACEVGFWGGSNSDVLNCSGDTSIGPLYSEDVYRKGSKIELTILDNYTPRHGNHPALYLGGNNHNYIIKDGTTTFDKDLKIFVGGIREAHRWREGSGLHKDANSISVINETKYPIILGNNTSNNKIVSCGKVTDKGADNKVSNTNNCE